MLQLCSLSKYLKSLTKSHIFVSFSFCPYINLAIESVLLEDKNICEKKCVFIWRNSPSVIIGRFQNPWQECSMRKMSISGAQLCRRESGGGAVYHDIGNVNFTFFDRSQTLKREKCMNFMADFLKLNYKLNVKSTKRHDLILDDIYKISGSSAKILKGRSYHHCSLLCGSDLSALNDLLSPSLSSLESRATKSLKSVVHNLFYSYSSTQHNELIRKFRKEYEKRVTGETVKLIELHKLMKLPFEIESKYRYLSSWEWIYGQTPEFSVNLYVSGAHPTNLVLRVKDGFICSIDLLQKDDPYVTYLHAKLQLLIKCRFVFSDILEKLQKLNLSEETISDLVDSLKLLNI
ncbi:hypothetical protein HZS_8102 [Henneguya salminicola]|nr:hypothetical protein HZS_8102 [Henneguya salminicola]